MIKDALIAAERFFTKVQLSWTPEVPEPQTFLDKMWGEAQPEESDDDFEVDYGTGEEKETKAAPVRQHWSDLMEEVGFSKDEVYCYWQLEKLDITQDWEIRLWSAEAASLNPWISVCDWLSSPAQFEDKKLSREAYWLGSDAMIKVMSRILFKMLDRTERYC